MTSRCPVPEMPESDLRDSQKAAMTNPTLHYTGGSARGRPSLATVHFILGGCFRASFSKKLERPLREKAELAAIREPLGIWRLPTARRGSPLTGKSAGRLEACPRPRGASAQRAEREGVWNCRSSSRGSGGTGFRKENCRSVVSWALSPGEGSPGGGSCL